MHMLLFLVTGNVEFVIHRVSLSLRRYVCHYRLLSRQEYYYDVKLRIHVKKKTKNDWDISTETNSYVEQVNKSMTAYELLM